MAPAINGDHPLSNGSHTMGEESEEALGTDKLINSEEFVRLLEQSLRRLGFLDVAEHLEKASGIQMQDEYVSRFQEDLLLGRWEGAIAALPQLTQNPADVEKAHFLILQQKYLEAISSGQLVLALKCLRTELSLMRPDETQLKRLAGCLLHQKKDGQSVVLREEWGELESFTRGALMQELQRIFGPTKMIPEGRLETLVQQALTWQVSNCPYHNSDRFRLSLFSDYHAGIEQIPTRQAEVLDKHTDEVWQLAWSHRGDLLGSASKDGTAIIWRVQRNGKAKALQGLRGHNKPLTSLCWSPDDTRILTCAQDGSVKLWEVSSGVCLHTYQNHTNLISSVAWLPDGKHFVVGSIEKNMHIFSVEGEMLKRWKLARINDLAVTRCGRVLVTVCQEKQIKFSRLPAPPWNAGSGATSTLAPQPVQIGVTEVAPLTSLTISPDGQWLLANLSNRCIHLWPLAPFVHRVLEPRPLGGEEENVDLPQSPLLALKMDEDRQGRFVIRSCFGGPTSSFVASGSEDFRVHVWHRESGECLAALTGHTGSVNAVDWNPTNPYMLASASDDNTVRIWVAPIMLERRQSDALGAGLRYP